MPAIALATLEQHIATKRLEPVYLLVGDDVRLIARLIDGIEATVDPADQPFAVERIYAGEDGGSAMEIADSARVLPMLGDRRIVIVLRAERFLKPKRAGKPPDNTEATEAKDPEDAEGTAMDLAPLEDYVKKPESGTTVVFVATDIDRGRRLTKAVMAQAEVLTLTGLDGENTAARVAAREAAAPQVKADLQRLGRSIDPKALTMLVDRAGGDISKLRDDVERLALYTEGQTSISRADVEEVAAIATSVDDDFAVVNAMADGDTARALRETIARLDRGDSVHAMVGQIRWWVSARLSESAPERVKPALDALLRTDLALKSSGGDERVLVERLVVELTGKPIARPSWGGRR